MDDTTKTKAKVGGGAAALIIAFTGAYTAIHGSHSTTTAENKTPVVINRPHDASGSPLPVTVSKLPNGTPLVIVGSGAPTPESPLGVACGVERWHVKTGIDSGAKSVKTTPVDTTIAALAALPVPAGASKDQRTSPTETTVYRITATVTAYKTEADSDVHLALSDGKGHTMIAEIPDPGCVGASSPFKAQIAAASKKWSDKHPGSPGYLTVNQKVVLTGVGFFDKIHGQRGVAPNGIELHPVLSLTFQ